MLPATGTLCSCPEVHCHRRQNGLSAKNYIPWFSDGRKPKDLDILLKDVLKLHITGVIIHGKPDKRFLFCSWPFLPGNANLNIECLRRAFLHALAGMTFRPKLYIQCDNASDNKCYAVLCICAWLVLEGYVSQAPAHSSYAIAHTCSMPHHQHNASCSSPTVSISP